MRKIIRNIFWLMLIFGALFWWIKPMQYFSTIQLKTLENKHIKENTRNSLTYILSGSRWLTFSIPSFSNELKFLYTANLYKKEIENIEENPNIRFSIEYELLDSTGKMIHSKIHHFKTSFIVFKDENQSLQQKIFYVDSKLQATMSETLHLDLHKSKAFKIRMKLHTYDSRVADIGVRCYHLEKVSQYNKKVIWERLRKDRQDYLSRGNVFSSSYITQTEKDNIVSSLWKPSGPLGVEDKDYTSRRLYFLNDVDNLHMYMQTVPSLYARANLNVTRYLKKGSYSLLFTPDLEEVSSLVLNYYHDKKLLSHEQYTLEGKKKTISFESYEDGILEILSTKGVAIEIKDAVSKQTLHLPAFISGDYYHLDANSSLQYDFFSPKKRLLRIQCRNTHLKDTMIGIEMRDAQGSLVDNVEKKLKFLPSKYDYMEGFIAQSEASSFYLDIDKNVSSVVFSSSTSVSLRVSTQSQKIAFPLYSFSSQQRPDLKRLNGWFSIRPNNFSELKFLQRYSVVYKQVKIPVIKDSIKEGTYHYEQLESLNSVPSYEFLVPRSLGDKFIRSQSWSSFYSKIQTNKAFILSFKADIGLNYVKPKVLYYNNIGKNNQLIVYVDKVVTVDKNIFSASGMIKLPELELKKRYLVQAKADKNIDLYISNTQNSSQLYIKRKFNIFTRPMQFEFMKMAKEETLGFQLVSSSITGDKALTFRVKIEGKKDKKSLVYDSITFKHYALSMKISKEPIDSIGSVNKGLFLSDSIYISLGEDLKERLYTITVYPPENSNKSYVFINHISLDKRASTRLSKEVI
ncbi:hypothetical protein JHD50_09445 [Sulfurimonas sp. MAG313]|nr:hypothetical protein [Sulfurimonas sp. MAG313]MDF1881522.1 hypothetical protein [Sulfurimonas sp. MAG313]